jgi:glycine dehydrogenase subunit 2
MSESLLFEKSSPGRRGYSLSDLDVPQKSLSEMIPAAYLRKEIPSLPELSESEVVRHFHRLSVLN